MGEAILRLEGVCKSFGGVVTAKQVNLEVQPGEIHGLIGPNGAGKSTMMNLISGIYEVDEGKIFFHGEDVTNIPSHIRARKGIGRTFQTPRFLYRSNIRDNLMLGVDLHDQLGYLKSFIGIKGSDFLKELDELMEMVGFTFDWDEDITAIPFGQRKILEIVRSMLSHPKVMLVDEPAAGLTTQERRFTCSAEYTGLSLSSRDVWPCSLRPCPTVPCAWASWIPAPCPWVPRTSGPCA